MNGHRSVVVWFTGLSGSGKSALAHTVEEMLHQHGCRTYTFDGDNVRHGLCAALRFSEQDRHENIRRIGEMVKLFLELRAAQLSFDECAEMVFRLIMDRYVMAKGR